VIEPKASQAVTGVILVAVGLTIWGLFYFEFLNWNYIGPEGDPWSSDPSGDVHGSIEAVKNAKFCDVLHEFCDDCKNKELYSKERDTLTLADFVAEAVKEMKGVFTVDWWKFREVNETTYLVAFLVTSEYEKASGWYFEYSTPTQLVRSVNADSSLTEYYLGQ